MRGCSKRSIRHRIKKAVDQFIAREKSGTSSGSLFAILDMDINQCESTPSVAELSKTSYVPILTDAVSNFGVDPYSNIDGIPLPTQDPEPSSGAGNTSEVMYCVVTFEENVAIVLSSWMPDANHTRWPGVSDKAHRTLLVNNARPDSKWKIYEVRLHKTTADYLEACRFEFSLEQNTGVSSSDATVVIAMDNNKRKTLNLDDRLVPVASSSAHHTFGEDRIAEKSIHLPHRPFPLPTNNESMFRETGNIHTTSLSTRDNYKRSHNQSVEDRLIELSENMDTLKKLILQNIAISSETRESLQYQLSSLRSDTKTTISDSWFPVRTMEDLRTLNKYLENPDNRAAVMETFRKINGSSASSHVHSILRTVIADEFATSINWKGTSQRLAFEQTPLCWTIINSVMANNVEVIDARSVKKVVQTWFYHAKDRLNSKTKDKRRLSL